MATKDELMDENAVLRGRIAVLEAAEPLAPGLYVVHEGGQAVPVLHVSEELVAFYTDDGVLVPFMFEDGQQYVYDDGFLSSVSATDEGTKHPAIEWAASNGYAFAEHDGAIDLCDGNGNILVVGGAPGTQDDAKEPVVGAFEERIAMLEADVQERTIQRDEARDKLRLANEKLAQRETLHGHVDNLKAPY